MNQSRIRESNRVSARYVFDKRYACPLLDKIIAQPDQVIDDLGRILKHDRTTTVAKIEENGVAWVIKRYNTKNPWHALRRTLRRSRALICWTMSARLQAAGIRVPTPVGYIEKKIGPFRGRSYFFYEYVDAEDLLSYIKTHANRNGFESVFQKIKKLFDVLYAAKINHGDMKATNLLVGADRSITLLDLDAARQTENIESFARGYARDRSRFLENWNNDPDLRDRFDKALDE